ncbi:hypothetical protein LTR10_008588 [Elasticomyces elasticus]|nr:hypothetical protein LTR10_008588 [Elasticomyces elasticus]KAK4967460.1 hypothetical protein LTR42_010809 [Elasticomyces elasticus]
MGERSTQQQQRTPVYQGCCFERRQKGHVTANCSMPKRSSPINLANLPTEMLELIAKHLVNAKTRSSTTSAMSMRLTCRTICQKTDDYFCKVAFQHLTVGLTYASLQRLRAISQCSKLATRVQSVTISTRGKACDSYDMYELYREDTLPARAGILSQEERTEAVSMVVHTHFEQEDKAFVECSALDGILFTLAFREMPNLFKLVFPSSLVGHDASVRRVKTGKGESTTHVWLMVLASLAYAGSKPKQFEFATGGCSSCEGIDVQALSIPPDIAECIHGLTHLNLWLQTSGGHYKNPIIWEYNLARLLASTQQLSVLKLGFRKDFAQTSAIFANVVKQVRLPRLKTLHLNHMRCDAADMRMLLHNHTELYDLALTRLDLTGPVTFSDILFVLECEHGRLTQFECTNIAQDGFRLHFETLGELSLSEEWASRRPAEQADRELLNSFVRVSGPSPHCGKAEEWEGVQYKIGMLREDLRVADEMYNNIWPHNDHMWDVRG